MDENDDFWADLLGHIRDQVLVPVVGPELIVVDVDNTEQTLTTLIGQRLVERYRLNVSPGLTTMGEAVAAFLRERGRDEVDRLYRFINDTIVKLDPAPNNALCDLAAIADLRLFVSTTPDRLLAKAVNEVRFQGRQLTREIPFSPYLSTIEQSRNAQPVKSTDTVVVNLFGRAASTPQYVIHEEDRLEWLHALLSDEASLPDGIAYQLKDHPMLFIGCEIPDWFGRFLLRMSSSTRLSLESKQFFLVGCSIANEPSLASFFATYCRKTQVQQLDMAPGAFVAELRARWEEQSAERPPDAVGVAPPSAPEIFISYMREDADAAQRLCDAIKGLGGEAWLDKRRIRPGDAWQDETLTAIRQTHLFIPLISANTEREDEGYAHTEWYEAIDRSRRILGRHFIVPVILDEDYEGDPSRYQRIPAEFRDFHFGSAPGGDPDAELVKMLTEEIRAIRRAHAA